MSQYKKPDWYIWYCKCKKSTGKPIGIYNPHVNRLTWHKELPKIITKEMVHIKMSFDNAIHVAQRSGATTILEVYRVGGINRKIKGRKVWIGDVTNETI